LGAFPIAFIGGPRDLPRGRDPAKQLELRRRRRNTERDFVDAVAIQLEITTAAVAELCR
jgi:hypothetical protein